MLKTRVITALILLAILLPILYFGYFPAFAMAVLVFFAAGSWECFRLFKSPRPTLWAAVWTLVFSVILFFSGLPSVRALYVLCVLLWALRFVPALGLGLPRIEAFGNRLLNGTYMLSILGCFVAIVDLFQHSPLYLLSVMAVVWVADIGAYFSGKGFGRHKLAPSISPGKSWEGAIGGWLAVLVISAAVAMSMSGGETFQYHLFNRWGWGGFVGVLSLMVVASVVGDLFESQLKRRAGMKDSSNLLPGHGGVLDRIDALIPVLPLAALVDLWLAAA
ncbi:MULTISPECIES: phosphatidate cytidylyltransferase [Herbaspirillum]|uniref:Phosphatidate cytidylyltransferase n=3 Tax=Herbaspirillum TaxID=963 RepID=A0AAJ2H115_9BURK|nr:MULTISPECIES: phosphatidate cytidylyltransferase [Herbaspirillum]MAF03196.1 phosphatidate cytidylyltransferase [Herbaspirillum sp.]MBO17510.1 phosphatidate cytidylyltransferase [Herbaspirillum sp.]MDR9834472.1 phosphatidate cytidylyltransferase [Herbaspirillum huttiense]MEE1635709.1 phosphatidate cytidylyltransferase [Herbaspirillum huttiense NC40101]|tara:strand:- start:855 stop:1682 length:828 start_codon:yes stop_codon:yes gene_type:complete